MTSKMFLIFFIFLSGCAWPDEITHTVDIEGDFERATFCAISGDLGEDFYVSSVFTREVNEILISEFTITETDDTDHLINLIPMGSEDVERFVILPNVNCDKFDDANTVAF